MKRLFSQSLVLLSRSSCIREWRGVRRALVMVIILFSFMLTNLDIRAVHLLITHLCTILSVKCLRVYLRERVRQQ